MMKSDNRFNKRIQHVKNWKLNFVRGIFVEFVLMLRSG